MADLEGKRVVLVASTGGHLNELVRLSGLLGLDPASLWVTFDTPQSRSLLRDRRVQHVPYVKPRDWKGVLRAAVETRGLVREYDGVLSTGAAIALSVLPSFLLANKAAVYIESVCRLDGPSLSGRLLSFLPRVGLYTQHSTWVGRTWVVGPSILSSYELRADVAARPLRRLFVTLGTIAPYRFDRLIDATRKFLARHADIDVVWQVGATTRDDLPGRVVEQMDEADYAATLAWADVVVAHAGVGVALDILDTGKPPILFARRHDLGEHVDDHQREIHGYLLSRGLGFDGDKVLSDDDLMARVLQTSVVAP